MINATIVNAVAESVFKLLNHATDLVRKKAVMVMQRIYQINPNMVADYTVILFFSIKGKNEKSSLW